MKLAILIAIVALQFTGCCFIGLAVGDKLDVFTYSSKSSSMIGLDTNQDITVTLSNQDTIVGKFKGMSTSNYDEYFKNYEKARNEYMDSVKLPLLGEDLFCMDIINYCKSYVMKSEWSKETIQRLERNSRFYGFDFSSILFSNSDYEKSIRIPLKIFDVKSTEANMTYNLVKIKSLLQERKLPLVSNMVVKSNGADKVISANNIVRIEKSQFPINTVVGFTAGLAIDIIIIKSAIDNMSFDFSLGQF